MGLIGGNDAIPNIAPPNEAPVWTSTPTPGFVDGVGGTYDLNAHVFDAEGDTLTFSLNGASAALPTGVTLSSAGTLTGTASVVEGTITGILFDVNDGTNGDVTSASVTITVTQQVTNADLRSFGYRLVDDYAGVDPTGTVECSAAINTAIADSIDDGIPLLFSANAVYRCNDSILLGMFAASNSTSKRFACLGLGGKGTSRARPKLKLDNGVTAFKSGTERPFVCIRRFTAGATSWPSDPLNDSGVNQSQANVLFNCYWHNIDIDCGTGNVDCIGMYAPVAQRCFLSETTITANDAKVGLHGVGGRNSPWMDLKIIGGVTQIRNMDVLSRDGSGGSMIAGLELVGDANTVTPIQTQDFIPLTIVGFKITQVNSNPIWTAYNFSRTGYGQLVMFDGQIETGGGTVFSNAAGKNVYLRNVYVSGSDNLVQSGSEAVVTGSGTWKTINEYAYCDQSIENAAASIYETYNMLSGTINRTKEPVTSISNAAGAPTVDWVARHSIILPRVDQAAFENIADHGATIGAITLSSFGASAAEDLTDSRAAIQAAITAAESAGHNRVFFPSGCVSVSSPGIVMNADTVLFGTDFWTPRIVPHASWTPTSQVYVVTSANSASGAAHYSQLRIVNPVKRAGDSSASSADSNDWFSWTLWQTGKNSSSVMPQRDREFQTPSIPCNPKIAYSFANNAGGKHFGMSDTDGRQFGNVSCRSFKIENTFNPLHLYGCNMEISKSGAVDATVNMEIQNSSNIRVYNCKREGHAATALINDSDNVAFMGFGRQEADVAGYVFRFQGGTDNCLLALATQDQAGKTTLTGYGMPEEDITSDPGLNIITWPDGCCVYKRGTLNDVVMEI